MTTTMITVGSVCYALLMPNSFICFKQPTIQTLPPTPATLECASKDVAKDIGIKTCEWILK